MRYDRPWINLSVHSAMASNLIFLPLLRRELLSISSRSWRATSAVSAPIGVACPHSLQTATAFPPIRRRSTRSGLFIQGGPVNQRRRFSRTVETRYVEKIDVFDPSHIDRESDSVDVCIVGGGKIPTTPILAYPSRITLIQI